MDDNLKEEKIIDAEVVENTESTELNGEKEMTTESSVGNNIPPKKPITLDQFEKLSSFKNKLMNDRKHYEKVLAKRRAADKKAKKARKLMRKRAK